MRGFNFFYSSTRNIRLTRVNQWGPSQNSAAARDWTRVDGVRGKHSNLYTTGTPILYRNVVLCRESNAGGEKGEEKQQEPEVVELYVDLMCQSINF